MNLNMNKTLVRGSFILLVCFGIFNFLNFLYHILMARSLSVADYGILSSLLSIVYILGVFSDSILLILAKYTTKEHDNGKLKNIIKRSFKKALIVSLIVFIIYLFVSIPLAKILKIDYFLMALGGLLIFPIFFLPVNRGVMQGRKKFLAFGGNLAIESITKLVLGLFLVFIGFKVSGALGGFILGSVFAFVMSFLAIRDITTANETRAETKGIYNYSKPAFVITLAITLFYSLDIIIAKAFFPSGIAGSYAIASMLAKTIFWGTQPISKAMFPLSAENNPEKNKSENIFRSSFILLFALIILALGLFYFFPAFIVKIFSGKELSDAAQVLVYVGIGMSLLAFANLILLYKLSLERVKGYYYLFLLALVEILLLGYFSNNLMEFSIAFIGSAVIFFLGAIFLVRE